MTNARALLTSLVLCALPLVPACAQDDHGGVFADASYEDRGLAIETAAGLPIQLGILHIIMAEWTADADPRCITRVVAGDTATFTGVECDVEEQASFGGSVTIEGWSDFLDEDAEDEITLSFQAFSLLDTDGTALAVVDGTVDVMQRADGSGVSTVSMTAEFEGLRMELDGTMVCDAAPAPCRFEDARGATGALGEFAIEGSYRDRTGVIELVGEQRLRVDFDAAVDDCAPVTIDGQAASDHCWMQSSDEQ